MAQMKLLLMRHGQTDWNSAKRIQGSTDIQLNETGKRQAAESAAMLAVSYPGIKRIYSSSLLRARQTAEAIAERLEAECSFHDALQEVNFGRWEGNTWEEVKKKYPEQFRDWINDRRYTKPPEGESYQDVLERFIGELSGIIRSGAENDRVLIVTHGGMIMALQSLIRQTKFENMIQYLLSNTGYVEIDSSEVPVMSDAVAASGRSS